jgi:multidrug transporter EmrE-like cation transporter
MSSGSLALILLSVTLSALAQIAFKFGVGSAAAVPARASFGFLAVLLAPGVIVGLALYALGTLIWLNALGRVELSQAYPFVGLGFAMTTVAGWWLFGDTLSALRLFGIALVVGGTVLISRS